MSTRELFTARHLLPVLAQLTARHSVTVLGAREYQMPGQLGPLRSYVAEHTAPNAPPGEL